MRQKPGNAFRIRSSLRATLDASLPRVPYSPHFYGSPTHNIKGGWWLALEVSSTGTQLLRVRRWLGPQYPASAMRQKPGNAFRIRSSLLATLDASPPRDHCFGWNERSKGKNQIIREGRRRQSLKNTDGRTRQTGPGISRAKPRPVTDSWL